VGDVVMDKVKNKIVKIASYTALTVKFYVLSGVVFLLEKISKLRNKND
jgi:hypothetical protein